MSDKSVSPPPSLKQISAEDLARLARLARLEVPAEEAPRALRALNDMLAMMAQLRRAGVADADELSHVQFWGKPLRLREDKPAPGFAPEELLAAAPRASDGCFIVPKVIE